MAKGSYRWLVVELDGKRALICQVRPGAEIPDPAMREAKTVKVFDTREEALRFVREKGLTHVKSGTILGKVIRLCGNGPY